MNFTLDGGSFGNGRVVSYEIHNSHGSLVRRVECNKKNMMFERAIHQAAGFGYNLTWSSAYTLLRTNTANVRLLTPFCYDSGGSSPRFRYIIGRSRLGTGNTPNVYSGNGVTTFTTTDLDTPVLGWSTRYLASNNLYNFQYLVKVCPVADDPVDPGDPEELDGDYRIRTRSSFQYPLNNTGSILQIREVGFGSLNTVLTEIGPQIIRPDGSMGRQQLNARVVFDDPIDLLPDQFLVLTHEYDIKMPSFRAGTFDGSRISGIPNAGGVYRFLPGALPNNNSGWNINSNMVSVALHMFGGWATGSSTSSDADYLVAVFTREDALRAFGQAMPGTYTNSSTNTANLRWGFRGDPVSGLETPSPNNEYLPYQNDGIAQFILRQNRTTTTNATLNNWLGLQSMNLFGYQFLFDEPFDKYGDQTTEMNISVKFNLISDLG